VLGARTLNAFFSDSDEESSASSTHKTKTQKKATWGIDRIDQRKLPLDHAFHYPSNAGEGVDIYIIDTGINVDHDEFKNKDGTSRARWGKTIPANDVNADGHGHGTHVAGTTAGKTYGIAKKANVIAVKVLRSNGSGTLSDVVKGMEYALQQHKKKKNAKSVANMSLGGGKSRALDLAANRIVQGGIVLAVAAGNDASDACDYSPAGATGPVTAGATNMMDQLAWFSNIGPCVDIFAPGQDITSSWIGSEDAVQTISGTSMASPHVAGALAVLMGGDKEYTSTQELKDELLSMATKSALKIVPKDTTHKLLYLDNSKL
jgi:cerevisin